MKKWMLLSWVVIVAACASTYNLPRSERSRAYDVPCAIVWDAAIAAVSDAGLALVETERSHGRIKARAGGTIWDLKGHLLIVVIGEDAGGLVRVDANVQNVSDEVVDFGESQRLLRRYLRALDGRLL
jgi:hypothetical protein